MVAAKVSVNAEHPAQIAFRQMTKELTEKGLLARGIANYYWIFTRTFLLGATAWLILWQAPGWWVLLCIPFFVEFWMQCGYIGHEAGHNAVSDNSLVNWLVGLIAFPLMLCMSFRPWVIRHALHHAETNVKETDPDLENRLIAFIIEAVVGKTGVLLWIVKWQHWLYPFVGMLAPIGFRLDAWRFITNKDDNNKAIYRDEKIVERILLGISAASWLIAPTILFGFKWIPIFIVSQMLFGVHMAYAFAPNHKDMKILDKDHEFPFAIAQTETSRNVTPNWWIDFIYGKLNYQIEHHLFPTAANPSYPQIRPYVKAFCAEHGIEYTEDGFWPTLKTVHHALKKVALHARRTNGNAELLDAA
jgi:fatty acid desaturase